MVERGSEVAGNDQLDDEHKAAEKWQQKNRQRKGARGYGWLSKQAFAG
jgi:hypothetical protein